MPPRTRRLGRLLPITLAAVIGTGVTLAAAGPAAAAPTTGTVTISAPSTATEGTAFDATVTLPSVVDVYAYEAEFSYDPAVLSYVDGSATAPSGGFDTVTAAGGTVDVVHTRLGTSPALSGTVTFTLRFSAQAPGAAAIALSSLRLIDATAASTTAADVASSPQITVTAAATPTPTPTPTPTVQPAGDGAGGASTGGGSASTGDPSLASTGQDILPWVAGALALLVAGTGAVLTTAVRRRRAGGTR